MLEECIGKKVKMLVSSYTGSGYSYAPVYIIYCIIDTIDSEFIKVKKVISSQGGSYISAIEASNKSDKKYLEKIDSLDNTNYSLIKLKNIISVSPVII